MSTQTETQFSRALRRSRDRKSTRLNSSHDQISYAVFCLKKKKKHHLIRRVTHNRQRKSNNIHLHDGTICYAKTLHCCRHAYGCSRAHTISERTTTTMLLE